LEAKIQKVAREVYGARGVTLSEKAKAKLRDFTSWGFGKLPVCIAKTQYSLSDNPKLMGAPKDWELHVADASLLGRCGICGGDCRNMMLMPGLPKVSRAWRWMWMRRERLWGLNKEDSELTQRVLSSQRSLRRITQEYRLKPMLLVKVGETRNALRGV